MTTTIAEEPILQRALRTAHSRSKALTKEAFIQQVVDKALRMYLGLAADLSPSEAARLMSVHVNTVRNMHKAGAFPNAYYRSSRALRIPAKDIEALAAKAA